MTFSGHFEEEYSDFFVKLLSIILKQTKQYIPVEDLLIGASDSITEELTKPVSKSVTSISEITQNKLLVKFLYQMKLLGVA